MPDVFTPRQAKREARRILLRYGGRLPPHAKHWGADYCAAVIRACQDLSALKSTPRLRRDIPPPPDPPQDADAWSWRPEEDEQLSRRSNLAAALIDERVRQAQHTVSATLWARRRINQLFPSAPFSELRVWTI